MAAFGWIFFFGLLTGILFIKVSKLPNSDVYPQLPMSYVPYGIGAHKICDATGTEGGSYIVYRTEIDGQIWVEFQCDDAYGYEPELELIHD